MRIRIFTLILFLLINVSATNYYDAWLEKYDALLKKHVHSDPNNEAITLVDYKAMAVDPEYNALHFIGRTNGKRGRGAWRAFSPDKKLAFYVNFHNYLAINYTIRNNVNDSITDLDKAQKAISGALNKRVASMASALAVIRTLSGGSPMFHFALNRGILGDPPLRAEAYTGEKIQQQLQDQLKKFLMSHNGKTLNNGKQHGSK